MICSQAMASRLDELKRAIDRFAAARDWDKFHTPKNLAMAMSVEAAEVVEIFQWLDAEQSKRLPPAERAHLADELADVYVYLLKLAGRFDIDLVAAAKKKMRKNAVKYPVRKARGLATKYDRL